MANRLVKTPLIVALYALAALADVFFTPAPAIAQTATPRILISAPSHGTAKASSVVTFTVSYTGVQAVTLNASHVTLVRSALTTAGGPDASQVTVQGTGVSTTGVAVRTIALSGFSGNGLLGIAIAAGSATGSGKSVPAATAALRVAVDTSAPALTFKNPTITTVGPNSAPVKFDVIFAGASSIALSASTKALVSLTKTGTADATVNVEGTGVASRTVSLSAFTGSGTISLSIAASAATDVAGNQSASAASSHVLTVDNSDDCRELKRNLESIEPTLHSANFLGPSATHQYFVLLQPSGTPNNRPIPAPPQFSKTLLHRRQFSERLPSPSKQ